MTSFHEQLIQQFKYIEKNYPHFFTEEDYVSLANLRKTLLEQESDAIANWCEERPKIQNELDALLRQQNASDSGERGPKGGKPKFPPEDKKDDDEPIDNIVRRSKPSS
ncbi:hypothetical protein [Nostoc sp. ATCC 53789]|jgi:hypothetical protein|uniref:hypothetical protein n=1 Tax=Nostoc sp. ATCC 53789 TaxID=76335 RepID=UPI000DECCC3C|nr:hypothetical protein [Nostoc sp. ATCC 53789]QHG18977.1 hypothetical protein GJB62_25435 [Nostoc sp. ATCC 53789]RCJ17474.1 hypothetical protein A6V25_29365 [Nostoc sp. ATCC 53789]